VCHPELPLSLAAGLLLVLTLAACGDRANGVPVSADTTPSPTTSPDLSDANIIALLDHAHDADSSAGALAAIKATNPQVKRFAQRMMADHNRLRKQVADLARRLGLASQPRADDPITPLAHQGMDALLAAAKGVEFDRTYIGHEIAAHRTVLDLADQAHEAAGNAELKALVERARPLIESHLIQAQAIEQELG
jgi:putative membrane protein